MDIEQEIVRLWIDDYLEDYLWTLIIDWSGLEFKYDLEARIEILEERQREIATVCAELTHRIDAVCQELVLRTG